jgi:uncharacterized protein (DUF2236 family)
MKFFVGPDSIVRKIWGRADTTLFIFAGAAAEFALNKAVDWLYFTGRLPADPLGRLFSTIAYARGIIFQDEASALTAIEKINAIHSGVEKWRGSSIPDWAYRDVLFLLIGCSINSFELLEREMTTEEKTEVFEVFKRVGDGMKLSGLPKTFAEYEQMRSEHLQRDLIKSQFTEDLYLQYRKHLGGLRYALLKQVQLLVAPRDVSDLLNLKSALWMMPLLDSYKLLRKLKIEKPFRNCLLPAAYRDRIIAMDKA